jgi:hypothetical protein
MKRLGWLVGLVILSAPVWAAQKITVEQLKAMLAADKQAQKPDADVAAELRNVELMEQLTHSTMNGLAANVPGPLTTEQLFVLEIRSAVLVPPAADVPDKPAPDAAAQKAILDKARAYASTTYAQLPPVSATKVTRRFQDGAQQESGSAKNNANLAAVVTPIRYTASDETEATFRNGAEQDAPSQKTVWGQNGMIALMGQEPVLSAVMEEAQAGGKISWLRWQRVFGETLAVFSFAVEKKKSHYALDYCCFPEVTQAGQMSLRGTESPGGAGNYQSQDQWKHWKTTAPYHGEIYINPDTGVVMRLVVQAELKGSDPVRVENQRIDYGPEKVGDKSLVVPVQVLIDTLEQPYPDSQTGRFIMRHTLFIRDYKGYRAGS